MSNKKVKQTKQKCLLEEARKKLVEEIGEERTQNYPLYVDCPCPKCSPKC